MKELVSGCPLWLGLALQSVLGLVGCAPVVMPGFDADRAYASVVRQVEFGPRVPGTASHQACAAWLIAELQKSADLVETQDFELQVAGRERSFRNIVARYQPKRRQRVLLGAHWDTRPISERDADPRRRADPTPGANDAGSGVAVLLEIGRLLR